MPACPRTIVLGDVHLTPETPAAVVGDLAALVCAHAGARIVVAGDLFDLSVTAPHAQRRAAIARVLVAHQALREALAKHIDTGGTLWLVGGNHDADLAADAASGGIDTVLGVSSAARGRLRVSPWFFRDGALHLEHGHLYDPDNAPEHPLVVGEPSLGVHFTEHFIAPTGAHRYLNANEGTPLAMFLSAFTWYGRRGPYVVYRYFHAATTALLRSGPFYRGSAEARAGQKRLASFAECVGVDPDTVDRLLALGKRPTLESISRTFARLYLDRVAATLAIAGGLGGVAFGARRAGAATASLGALLMTLSWARGRDRYAGNVAARLADSAEHIADATGARLVVFGHTHREDVGPRYANTGSFAFPRGAPGRPLLEIEGSSEAPRAVRRYWPASAA